MPMQNELKRDLNRRGSVQLSFGCGEWKRVTTKDTKSEKVEFDELSNRVIAFAIEVHQLNNTRLCDWIKRFVF